MKVKQEQLRPKTFDELMGLNTTVVGDITKKEAIIKMIKDDFISSVMLIGGSGTGKTSCAYLMACLYYNIPLSELLVNDRVNHPLILEVNASKDRGIAFVNGKLLEFVELATGSGLRRMVILQEADGMTPDAKRALDDIIEKASSFCIFIFTINDIKKTTLYLKSRCAKIYFDTLPFEEYRLWFKRTAKLCNVTIKNEDLIEDIYEHYRGDMRETIIDLFVVYEGSNITQFTPTLTNASIIFKANDRVAKYLFLARKHYLDPKKLLKDLHRLGGYKNSKIFAEAYNYLSNGCYPSIVITDVLQRGFI